MFNLTSEMMEQIDEQWESLPEGHPLRKKLIEQSHSQYRYMKRGRLPQPRMKKQLTPGQWDPYRELRLEPYQREVAGGGYKNRD